MGEIDVVAAAVPHKIPGKVKQREDVWILEDAIGVDTAAVDLNAAMIQDVITAQLVQNLLRKLRGDAQLRAYIVRTELGASGS